MRESEAAAHTAAMQFSWASRSWGLAFGEWQNTTLKDTAAALLPDGDNIGLTDYHERNRVLVLEKDALINSFILVPILWHHDTIR
jgi:hypothetical protein